MRIFLVITSLAAAGVAESQVVCRPDKDEREARLLAFFAAPIAFSPAGAATAPARGEVRLSFDGTWVPTPSDDLSRPERCYNNSKTENTSLSSVFPRPRLMVGLASRIWFEASYLPPVTVMDATPNLFSAALATAVPIGSGGATSLLLRTHVTIGQVKGPITCSSSVIQTSNPNGLCYANEPSEDTYKPNMFGGEVAAVFNGRGGGRLDAYLGAGVTSLRPRFEVGFTDAANNIDNTIVEVDLVRVAAFAGGRWRVGPRTALTAEVYSVPQDITTFRLGGSYTLRTGR
ncbi:MAG: hypothetical protein ACT4OZ_02085 [Gemmatimonadota bacterium]